MLNRLGYRKAVDNNRLVGTASLWRRIKKSSAPRWIKPQLEAAAYGGGVGVHEFAVEERKLNWRKAGQDEIDDFLTAIRSNSEAFLAAQRVATWALLAHDYGITRSPDTAEGLVAKAIDGLGIENPQEQWVATFGPIPESSATGEDRHAQFLFGSGERMIEAALGRSIERASLASAALEWSVFFSVAMRAQESANEGAQL